MTGSFFDSVVWLGLAFAPTCSVMTSALFARAWNVAALGVLTGLTFVERTGVWIVGTDGGALLGCCCCRGTAATIGRRAFYDERSVFMRGEWVQSYFHIRGGITVEKTVQSIYFDSRRLVRFFLRCWIILLLDRVFSIHIEVFHDHWSETTMKIWNKRTWDR